MQTICAGLQNNTRQRKREFSNGLKDRFFSSAKWSRRKGEVELVCMVVDMR